ncbi:MAG: translocation/assembly module TamB domain-containing protein, partial [Vicinamibacterales bacterium]
MIDRRRVQHRWKRRALLRAGGLLAGLALLIGLLHTPAVRAGLFSWARTRLQAAGVQVDVARLEYNLLTLTADLKGLRLTTVGSDTPFFTAEALRLDLPWSIVAGTLHLESVEVERPRIAILRRDGVSNLQMRTSTSRADGATVRPLRVDRLLIRDLDARFADTAISVSVEGQGVSLDLHRPSRDRLTGRLTVSDRVTARVRNCHVTTTTFDAQVAFDGTTLSAERFTIQAPEGQVRLDGTIRVWSGEPEMDLRFAGRLEAEWMASCLGLAPAPQGFVAFSGAAAGALRSPAIALDVTTDQLAWSTLGPLWLKTRVTASTTVVVVESLQASLAGGQVTGAARLQLSGPGVSDARATFTNVNVGTLAHAIPGLPVALAGLARGEAMLTWTGLDPTTAEGNVATDIQTARGQGKTIGMAGRVDLRLSRGTWRLSVGQRIADTVALHGQAAGRLTHGRLMASTVQGRVGLDVGSLSVALRRLRAAGVVIDASLEERVRGGLSATIDFGGTLETPAATGTVEARDLWFDETGPGRVRLGFNATRQRVSVDPLRLDIGSNVVSGGLIVGLDAETLRGGLRGNLPDLGQLARAWSVKWRPEGSARFDLEVSGTLDNPTARVAVRADAVRIAGQTLGDVQATVQLAQRILEVDQFELNQAPGRLTATGRYAWATGAYRFEASGSDLATGPPAVGGRSAVQTPAGTRPIPLSARFDIRVKGDGTLASPRADAVVEFSQLEWNRYAFGAPRAELTLDHRAARLAIAVPSLKLSVRAEAETVAPRAFAIEAEAAALPLSVLARLSGLAVPPAGAAGDIDASRFEGTVSLRALGNGRLDELPRASVHVNLNLANAVINGAPVRLARSARFHYAAERLVIDDLDVSIGDTTFMARGAWSATGPGSGFVAQLRGSLTDVVPIVRLAPGAERVKASGAIDLQLRTSGQADVPEIMAECVVADATIASDSWPPVRGVGFRATYQRGLLEVTDLRGTWQGASLAASARIPTTVFENVLPERVRLTSGDAGRTARATAQVTSITPDLLRPFMDARTVDQMAGHVDAEIVVEAESLDWQRVRADLRLERAELEVARVPITQVRPTQLRLASGRLDVVDWSWTGAGNHLDVGGHVVFGRERPRLALTAVGELDLRILGAFAPQFATGGRASISVTASGPTDDPLVEGQIEVSDASAVIREPRLAITDLHGIVALSRNRLEVRDLSGAANGGALRVRGDVAYPVGGHPQGVLTITGRGVALEGPANLHTEVDTELELALSGDAPALSGRVTILRGAYREPISLAGHLLTGVQAALTVPPQGEPTAARRVVLGVAVVSEEAIRVDNNYGRLDLESNLRVTGTFDRPILAGRLTMREGGEIDLGGQTYHIRRGTVDF